MKFRAHIFLLEDPSISPKQAKRAAESAQKVFDNWLLGQRKVTTIHGRPDCMHSIIRQEDFEAGSYGKAYLIPVSEPKE